MGWASAGDIFDPVAKALIDANANDEVVRRVLGRLIAKLQDGDWDTEDESLEAFRDEPAVVAAFADNGITLDEEEDDDVEPRPLGEVAYSGYFVKCGGKSLISGSELPSWDEQSHEIRAAWQAAADAVVDRLAEDHD